MNQEQALQTCLEEHTPVICLVSVLGSTEEGAVDHIHEIVGLQSKFKEKELNLKLSKDLASELERLGIKLRVLNDPPDTNIICFIANKEGYNLKEMNKFNEDIYNELKFNPEEAIQSHDFIISCTTFPYDKYGNSMKEHLEQLKVPFNQFEDSEIMILRCTNMSPWPALRRGGKPDYITEFYHALKKIIVVNAYSSLSKLIKKQEDKREDWFQACVYLLNRVKEKRKKGFGLEEISNSIKSEFELELNEEELKELSSN